MSDRIALMRDGRVVETGSPEDLYLRPRKRFTAEFLGRTVILSGTPKESSANGHALQTSIGVVVAAVGADLAARARRVMFRPEHILLREDGAAGENAWPGIVTARRFAGRLVDYTVMVNETAIPVQTTSATMLPVGANVTMSIPSERCVLLEE